MKNSTFQSTRASGKSNVEVLLEMFSSGEPGQVYTFGDIIDALDKDSSRAHNVLDVRGCISRAYKPLLKQQSRAVRSVRGVGYRLAEAKEHNQLAEFRRSRADKQFQLGIETLRNVRWDELDPESRKAHEGTLMLYSALESQQRALDTRLRRIEDIVGRFTIKDED